MTPEQRAEEWLIKRFPAYEKDKSGMDVDTEVYMAGYAACFEWVLERLRSEEAECELEASDGVRWKPPKATADWLQAEAEREK